MTRIVFVTYGDSKYFYAKQRILHEAKQTGWFDACYAWGPENLTSAFRKRYSKILAYPRGAGYWIWKFDIIRQLLDDTHMQENDIVVYCDAGCTINPKGKTRFEQYCADLLKSPYGAVSFQMETQQEHLWSPRELFSLLDVSFPDTTGHYVGGILLFKKCSHTDLLLRMCMYVLEEKPMLVTDAGYQPAKQCDAFRENRHDQSILSLVRKKYGSVVYPDETYCDPGPPFQDKFPFWATRKRI